jgi:hypothetical protein
MEACDADSPQYPPKVQRTARTRIWLRLPQPSSVSVMRARAWSLPAPRSAQRSLYASSLRTSDRRCTTNFSASQTSLIHSRASTKGRWSPTPCSYASSTSPVPYRQRTPALTSNSMQTTFAAPPFTTSANLTPAPLGYTPPPSVCSFISRYATGALRSPTFTPTYAPMPFFPLQRELPLALSTAASHLHPFAAPCRVALAAWQHIHRSF